MPKQNFESKRYYQKINNSLSKAPLNFACYSKPSYPTFPKDLKSIILSNEIVGDNIYEALVRLVSTTSNDNLLRLCHNINTASFSSFAVSKKDFVMGYFKPSNNTIFYSDQPSLYHELLHLSSCIKRLPNTYVGFEKVLRVNGRTYFLFRGLNEGYTELLNRRKFFNENYSKSFYLENVYIALLLEKLVDKNELEDAFFNNDTRYFLSSFLECGTKEELFEITKKLDYFAVESPSRSEALRLLYLVREIIERNNIDGNDIVDEYKDITKPKIHLLKR